MLYSSIFEVKFNGIAKWAMSFVFEQQVMSIMLRLMIYTWKRWVHSCMLAMKQHISFKIIIFLNQREENFIGNHMWWYIIKIFPFELIRRDTAYSWLMEINWSIIIATYKPMFYYNFLSSSKEELLIRS